jgi:hypothetical protein
MIEEDIIEGIIALPPKLFYGTGIPGCVLILNRNKPESRMNKIILIYGARYYEEGKVRNKLRGIDIQKTGVFAESDIITSICLDSLPLESMIRPVDIPRAFGKYFLRNSPSTYYTDLPL